MNSQRTLSMFSGENDIHTGLHYTKIIGNGDVGPMVWGRTAFDEDVEELVPVTICNIRGYETGFCLDRNGFQIVDHHTRLTKHDFNSRALVKKVFYDEVASILRNATGCSKVKITHHVLRKSKPPDPDNSLTMTRPITQVHVDSNEERVKITLRALYKDDYPALLSRRYAMVNVWKPLKRVTRDPLGFCDGSSVPDEDFVLRQIIMPDGSKQVNTGVINGEGHAWRYLHHQEANEVLLLKCWDSKEGVIKRCPHSAILHAEPGSGIEERESIELRCILLWDD